MFCTDRKCCTDWISLRLWKCQATLKLETQHSEIKKKDLLLLFVIIIFELFLQQPHHHPQFVLDFTAGSSSVSILQCTGQQLFINTIQNFVCMNTHICECSNLVALCEGNANSKPGYNYSVVRNWQAKCFVDVSSPLILQQKTRHANVAKECKPALWLSSAD